MNPIKAAREEAGKTQEQVSAVAGVGTSTLSAIERGGLNVTADRILGVCRELTIYDEQALHLMTRHIRWCMSQ